MLIAALIGGSRKALVYVICVVLLAAPGAGLAGESPGQPPVFGLAVQPGGLLLQDLQLGETYDLQQAAGISLTIINQDGQDHAYLLSTQRPSQSAGGNLPAGYADLPDPSWFWLGRTEVTVPAQGSVQVPMYFRIPKEDVYANQRWSVTVGVTGKPGEGEPLALAVYPRYELETVSVDRPALSRRPVGELVLVPGTVVFAGMRPGEWREAQFYVSNDDRRGHSYRFRVLPTGPEVMPRVTNSPGFTRLPDQGWLRTRESRVYVSRHRALSVRFRVKLPRTAVVPEGGWEAILLVTREDGLMRFLRVQVPPVHPAGQEGGN